MKSTGRQVRRKNDSKAANLQRPFLVVAVIESVASWQQVFAHLKKWNFFGTMQPHRDWGVRGQLLGEKA